MKKKTLALLIISVARGRSIEDAKNVISSLGDSVVLDCPSSPSSSTCPSSCSWTGPANVSCSTNYTAGCDSGLDIRYNISTCVCLLVIKAASNRHRGDWLCTLDQEVEVPVENIEGDDLYNEGFNLNTHNETQTANQSQENLEEVVNVQLIRTVVEEKRTSLFYILFFSLALLAKLLLLGVIIFALFIAFCKGGRMPRPVLYPLPSVRRGRSNNDGGREEVQQGDSHEKKVFNGRICQIK
jgi:hypothetical protein